MRQLGRSVVRKRLADRLPVTDRMPYPNSELVQKWLDQAGPKSENLGRSDHRYHNRSLCYRRMASNQSSAAEIRRSLDFLDEHLLHGRNWSRALPQPTSRARYYTVRDARRSARADASSARRSPLAADQASGCGRQRRSGTGRRRYRRSSNRAQHGADAGKPTAARSSTTLLPRRDILKRERWSCLPDGSRIICG